MWHAGRGGHGGRGRECGQGGGGRMRKGRSHRGWRGRAYHRGQRACSHARARASGCGRMSSSKAQRRVQGRAGARLRRSLRASGHHPHVCAPRRPRRAAPRAIQQVFCASLGTQCRAALRSTGTSSRGARGLLRRPGSAQRRHGHQPAKRRASARPHEPKSLTTRGTAAGRPPHGPRTAPASMAAAPASATAAPARPPHGPRVDGGGPRLGPRRRWRRPPRRWRRPPRGPRLTTLVRVTTLVRALPKRAA